ncbi:MAG TPA: hypothetical protein VEP90_00350 [Methylomirabilota bacterium]|nr:hypothetical protein [Methylomirabilota bacterium]
MDPSPWLFPSYLIMDFPLPPCTSVFSGILAGSCDADEPADECLAATNGINVSGSISTVISAISSDTVSVKIEAALMLYEERMWHRFAQIGFIEEVKKNWSVRLRRTDHFRY